MAYVLQAILGDAIDLESCSAIDMPAVALPQAKALIALTASVRETHGIPFCPLTDDGELPAVIGSLVASTKKKIAYLEAELFGGDGMQAAAVWDEGRLVFGPVVADDAINQVLRLLGVEKGDHLDEFDALNLGRHRDTDKWA